MSRKPITGRFETREELCDTVWREWLFSPRNQTEIARFCKVSTATVGKILDSKEGLPLVRREP